MSNPLLLLVTSHSPIYPTEPPRAARVSFLVDLPSIPIRTARSTARPTSARSPLSEGPSGALRRLACRNRRPWLLTARQLPWVGMGSITEAAATTPARCARCAHVRDMPLLLPTGRFVGDEVCWGCCRRSTGTLTAICELQGAPRALQEPKSLVMAAFLCVRGVKIDHDRPPGHKKSLPGHHKSIPHCQ